MKLIDQRSMYKLVKVNAVKRGEGRLLGLNVGRADVDVAVSRVYQFAIKPQCVLVREKTNIEDIANDCNALISYYSVLGFVIGYPFYGAVNGQDPRRVKRFVDDLTKTKKLKGIPYTFLDTSYRPKKGLYPINNFFFNERARLPATSTLKDYLRYMEKVHREGRTEYCL